MKRMYLELDKLTHKQLNTLLQACTDEVRSRNGSPVLPTPHRTSIQMSKCVVVDGTKKGTPYHLGYSERRPK